MGETLDENESHFWYFNSGITALCSSIGRLAKGAGSRNVNVFLVPDAAKVVTDRSPRSQFLSVCGDSIRKLWKTW
jgi:hypothetical protein